MSEPTTGPSEPTNPQTGAPLSPQAAEIARQSAAVQQAEGSGLTPAQRLQAALEARAAAAGSRPAHGQPRPPAPLPDPAANPRRAPRATSAGTQATPARPKAPKAGDVVLEQIVHVLHEAEGALHYAELGKRVLEAGLLTTNTNPGYTVYGIAKKAAEGDPAHPVVFHRQGVFSHRELGLTDEQAMAARPGGAPKPAAATTTARAQLAQAEAEVVALRAEVAELRALLADPAARVQAALAQGEAEAKASADRVSAAMEAADEATLEVPQPPPPGQEAPKASSGRGGHLKPPKKRG